MELYRIRIYFMLISLLTLCITILMYMFIQHWNVVYLQVTRKGNTNNLRTTGYNFVSKGANRYRHVLILTYMRCGSTLVGDILQSHPKSFYAFEPLRFIDDDISNNRMVHFLNGTKRFLPILDQTRIHAEMVYRWFTCDFKNININDLSSRFIGLFSNNLREYANCIQKNGSDASGIKMCLVLMETQCIESQIKIVKTIRMKMISTHLLMKWLPNLKIIHLIRDPRGKMVSEIEQRITHVTSYSNFIKKTCDQIMEDTLVTGRLKVLYPERIRVLLYEILATNPMRVCKRMHEFLEMEFSMTTRELVKVFTQSNTTETCTYCTKRTNSEMIYNLWRLNIDIGLVNLIDRQCYNVYRKIGYIRLSIPADIRNISKSLIIDTPFTANQL